MAFGQPGIRPPRNPYGGAHGGRGRSARGRLTQVHPKGPALPFQWNPESLRELPPASGWQETARPEDKAVTEWTGQGLRRITFTLILDGRENDRSVEPECRILDGWLDPRSRRKPPPVLKLDYGPIGTGKTRWVIESLDWAEGETRNRALQRTAQDVTVVLLEHNAPDVALSPADQHRRGGGDVHGSVEIGPITIRPGRSVAVVAGDTLARIAARELGDQGRWTEIAALNDLRDPNYVQTGQSLRLPEA